MRLYHFTSAIYLPHIIENGINRGDVPLSETASVNGVWLTREGEKSLQSYNRTSRMMVGDHELVHDKAEIRITVELEVDSFLFCWSYIVGRLGIDPKYAQWLNGFGNESGENWYVKFKTIPLKEMIEIERSNGKGGWDTVRDLSVFPKYQIRSVSAWELETGSKIDRISSELVLARLRH